MAIGSAIERGSLICVYRRTRNYALPEGQGIRRQGRIAGITGSTVTVRFGSIIYTYDEKGMTIYSKAA